MILTLFNSLIGKSFCKNGNKYKGEWKDDKEHGLGDLLSNLFSLTMFIVLIGNSSFNNGDIYEGEFKVGNKHGLGKKNKLMKDL